MLDWRRFRDRLKFGDFDDRRLATELLDYAMDVARSESSTWIFLRIRREAEALARLFARNGFVCDGQGDVDVLPEIFLLRFLHDLH